MGPHYFDTQQVTSNHIKVKLKGWFTIKDEQLVHSWDKPFQVHASICKRGNDCQNKKNNNPLNSKVKQTLT
jgi:hypothetical protein